VVQIQFEEVKPDSDDLLVFIDDTGHETFAGNQGFYGLGGCILPRHFYDHLKTGWNKVRAKIGGDADMPLHASQMSQKAKDLEAMTKFFADRSFFRVAVTTTKHVKLPANMHPCVPIMGQLREEIDFVAARLSHKRMWIFVESSQRADPLVRECFSQLTSLTIQGSSSVEHCFMPKSANEQGLEVADFVVSAASSQIQRRLRNQSGQAPDFKVVFGTLPFRGCRYREVTSVAVQPDGTVGVHGVRFAGGK
jgi:hypothetical protein